MAHLTIAVLLKHIPPFQSILIHAGGSRNIFALSTKKNISYLQNEKKVGSANENVKRMMACMIIMTNEMLTC